MGVVSASDARYTVYRAWAFVTSSNWTLGAVQKLRSDLAPYPQVGVQVRPVSERRVEGTGSL